MAFKIEWGRETHAVDAVPSATSVVMSRVVGAMGSLFSSKTVQEDPEKLADWYRKNTVIRACVNEIASSAAQPTIIVKRRSMEGIEEPVEPAHPLARLMRRPNRSQSQFEWLEQLVIDFQIFGDEFTHKVRETEDLQDITSELVELWNLRPYRVKINIDKKMGTVGSYTFRRSETDRLTFPVENVMHLRMSDPTDDFHGLSPIVSVLDAVKMDNAAQAYLNAFFVNGGVPHGILNIKGQVDGDERARAKEIWKQQHQGERGWHDLAVLDGEVTYQEIGTRPDKLNMDKVFDVTESRLCAAFQVPPILIAVRIGLMRSTFANYAEARRSFWQETLMPLYVRIADKMTHSIACEFGEDLVIDFDLSDVEELQESEDTRRSHAKTAYDSGIITHNEARVLVEHPSLGMIGDIFKRKTSDAFTEPLEPSNPAAIPEINSRTGVETEALPEGAGHPPTEPSLPPPGERPRLALVQNARNTTRDANDPEWKAVHRIADSREAAFQRAFLENRGLTVTPKIEKAVEAAFRAGQLVEVEAALELGLFAEGLEADLAALLEEVSLKSADAARPFLPQTVNQGLAFDAVNPLASNYAKEHAGNLVRQIDTKTRTAIKRIIASSFDDGLAPREAARQLMEVVGLTDKQAASVGNLRNRLIGRLGEEPSAAELARVEKRVARYANQTLRKRATTIARTEVIDAANEGQRLVWKSAVDQGLLDPDVQREWIVTPDDELDEIMCLPMAGQRRGLDEAFETGDGRSVMHAPVHPNCRCSAGLVLLEDEEE